MGGNEVEGIIQLSPPQFQPSSQHTAVFHGSDDLGVQAVRISHRMSSAYGLEKKHLSEKSSFFWHIYSSTVQWAIPELQIPWLKDLCGLLKPGCHQLPVSHYISYLARLLTWWK